MAVVQIAASSEMLVGGTEQVPGEAGGCRRRPVFVTPADRTSHVDCRPNFSTTSPLYRCNKAIVDGSLRPQCRILMNSGNTVAVWRPTVTDTWRTYSKYNVVLDSGQLAPWYKNDAIHKTGSIQRIATPPEEYRATATVKVHKNWRSSAPGFLRYAIGQTDILITIFRTQLGTKFMFLGENRHKCRQLIWNSPRNTN